MPNQYLIIISIIGWGVGYIFYKIANTSIHPIMVSAITTGVYCIATPIAFLSINFDKTVTTTGVLSSIVGGMLIGAGTIAYYYASRTGNAGQVTTLTALYPIVTLILSCLFMGEEMTTRKTIGIVLACISFYFLS
jgi:bacterial/archaeal transporter family protein